jgi:hypothetical protein
MQPLDWTVEGWIIAIAGAFGVVFFTLMLCEELVDRFKRLYFKIRNFNDAKF